MGADFRELQRAFAAHLRAPDSAPAPENIEDRRMGIYRDLVYNNLESFIAGAFPVLRSLYPDREWHALVRDFLRRHTSASPYFLQISEEFLAYLQSERGQVEGDPPFLMELAHYEWAELALEVSEAEFPGDPPGDCDLLSGVPLVSPLAWSLSYRFPVHRIGPAFRPPEPPQTPTFLVVYRNREHSVEFLEANAVTARLLQLAREERHTGRQLLEILAGELAYPDPAALEHFGNELLEKLWRLHIVAGVRY